MKLGKAFNLAKQKWGEILKINDKLKEKRVISIVK